MESQGPEYGNWVPKSALIGLWAGALACACLAAIAAAAMPEGTAKLVSSLPLLAGGALFAVQGARMQLRYRVLGLADRQSAWKIVSGIADEVHIPEGGYGLDVGCGSAALTIACAKRNPGARMAGVDLWGKGNSFLEEVCRHKAEAEGVSNAAFEYGDAAKLDFLDETFDAAVSSYVYHTISCPDRQKLLRETLATLKRGGTFVLHDTFTEELFGDMEAFVQELLESGYEMVELIDTADGRFMERTEAEKLVLAGSALLIGRK